MYVKTGSTPQGARNIKPAQAALTDHRLVNQKNGRQRKY